MAPKFRIVKRIGSRDLIVCGETVYVAQRKVLDLFWIDCRFIDSEDYHRTYDESIEFVDKYIKRKLRKHNKIEDEVVMTFYDCEKSNS